MKKSKKMFVTLSLFIALSFGCAGAKIQKLDMNQEADYAYNKANKEKIILKNYDETSIDSYPQKLLKKYTDTQSGDTVLELAIHNQSEIFYEQRLSNQTLHQNYPKDIKVYTKPSELIESDAPQVKQLAEKIWPGKLSSDADILKYEEKVSAWEMKNIAYDYRLAWKISNGSTWGYTAKEVIKKKQGTCGEFTNVCIALMRAKGIPARYAVGCYDKGQQITYHAWTEVYVPDSGWIPMDAEVGLIAGLSNYQVRLFTGKDMKDIGYRLKDIGAIKIERIYAKK